MFKLLLCNIQMGGVREAPTPGKWHHSSTEHSFLSLRIEEGGRVGRHHSKVVCIIFLLFLFGGGWLSRLQLFKCQSSDTQSKSKSFSSSSSFRAHSDSYALACPDSSPHKWSGRKVVRCDSKKKRDLVIRIRGSCLTRYTRSVRPFFREKNKSGYVISRVESWEEEEEDKGGKRLY